MPLCTPESRRAHEIVFVAPLSRSEGRHFSPHLKCSGLEVRASRAFLGVGAQPFGCDEAAVGSRATVTAAGARSRHEIKGPSEVQDEVSRGALVSVRAGLGPARGRDAVALCRRHGRRWCMNRNWPATILTQRLLTYRYRTTLARQGPSSDLGCCMRAAPRPFALLACALEGQCR